MNATASSTPAAPAPPPLSKFAVWKLAIRPKIFPAAATPVIVGTGAAIATGNFQPLAALAALLGAIFLQVASNLANDVGDFRRGADTAERLGPLRVTAAGLLTPREVMAGVAVAIALATLVGLYLVAVGGWAIVIIGVVSIVAALAYTTGPFPLAYYGLGEVFSITFFGFVAVCGTYFAQAGGVAPVAWIAALPIGLFAAMIIMTNNLRDIETDRAAGKRTVATFIGRRASQGEYLTMLALVYATPLALWLGGFASGWVLLAWLSLPLAVPLVRTLLRERGRALNAVLAGTARLELTYGCLLALGLALSRVS